MFYLLLKKRKILKAWNETFKSLWKECSFYVPKYHVLSATPSLRRRDYVIFTLVGAHERLRAYIRPDPCKGDNVKRSHPLRRLSHLRHSGWLRGPREIWETGYVRGHRKTLAELRFLLRWSWTEDPWERTHRSEIKGVGEAAGEGGLN